VGRREGEKERRREGEKERRREGEKEGRMCVAVSQRHREASDISNMWECGKGYSPGDCV
jgi:hypothetical protein